jgi:hypothetical protein
MISSRADEIHRAAKKKIEEDVSKYPPGLMEQYKVQLERLDGGAPGVEFTSIIGFASAPSTFAFFMTQSTLVCADDLPCRPSRAEQEVRHHVDQHKPLLFSRQYS